MAVFYMGLGPYITDAWVYHSPFEYLFIQGIWGEYGRLDLAMRNRSSSASQTKRPRPSIGRGPCTAPMVRAVLMAAAISSTVSENARRTSECGTLAPARIAAWERLGTQQPTGTRRMRATGETAPTKRGPLLPLVSSPQPPRPRDPSSPPPVANLPGARRPLRAGSETDKERDRGGITPWHSRTMALQDRVRRF